MTPAIRRGAKLIRRLDRAAAKVNPFLIVIAIGLAIITLTSFSVIAIKDALPPITRVSCTAPTSVSLARTQSVTTEVARRQVITDAVDTASSSRPTRDL
jgi:hypothetical protein